MNIGERTVTGIQSVAFGGAGVGRVSGEILFVPYTVDGDRVEVEITGVHRRYLEGRLLRILDPSPHRVAPECCHFGFCGGCQYQHILYDHQLTIKQRQVSEIFQRIGRVASSLAAPVLPSLRTFNYRGKGEFHWRFESDRVPRIGLMAARSGTLIEVSHCDIMAESINHALTALGTGAIPIPPHPSKRAVIWSLPEATDGVILIGREEEPSFIERVVNDRTFQVPGRGFFQANEAMTATLAGLVVEACRLNGCEGVLDAYCGSGFFSAFLSARCTFLTGIDSDPEAVQCARINCRCGKARESLFETGDLLQVLRRLPARQRRWDVVVLDPPRAGCGPAVLKDIVATGVRRILYVSCHPATQARDVHMLLREGYILTGLQPVDMFPQTAHIEVVASLERI